MGPVRSGAPFQWLHSSAKSIFIAPPTTNNEPLHICSHQCEDRPQLSATVLPQGSFWFHDDSDAPAATNLSSSKEKNLLEFARSKLYRLGKLRCIVVVSKLAGVLAIGGIASGVLVANKAAAASRQPSSTGNRSDQPGDTNITPIAAIHSDSQLATSFSRSPTMNFRILVFHDLNLELTVTEWCGKKTDTYRLKDRMGDQSPPKPFRGSPFHLIAFGLQNDLHLFYLATDNRPIHLSRLSGRRCESTWQIGSLEVRDSVVTKGSRATHDLRQSAAVLYRPQTTRSNWESYTLVRMEISHLFLRRALAQKFEMAGLQITSI